MNVKSGEKNNSGKKTGITVVDVLIFALIIAAVFTVYKFVLTNDTSSEVYPISYVVKVPCVRGELSDRISVGDSVFLTSDNSVVGTVRAYEVTSAVIEKTGQTVPGMYDLYITVEAQSERNGGVYVSGYEINVEGKYSMRTNSFAFDGICISVGT